jgi:hydroxymethylbilane synthase
MTQVRVGTRGSALAVTQAEWVAARLRQSGIDGVELVRVVSAGDRGEAVGDKSRWVSTLEQALLEGSIDLAVHSAKDVPGELAAGTVLAAIPEREDPSDVLIGARSLSALPAGARVGTASLRRAAQLRALREDLQVVEIRGNVDTRLRKLDEGAVDALVLAAAGLLRLGLGSRITQTGAPLEQLLPAAGQGALAVQAVAGSAAAAAAAAIEDPDATVCVGAERALTIALGASCHTAVGAFATPAAGASSTVELRGWVGLPDGSEWIADRLVGPASEVGTELAERMASVGARELLARAQEAAV